MGAAAILPAGGVRLRTGAPEALIEIQMVEVVD
jgi:hypothetical protein